MHASKKDYMRDAKSHMSHWHLEPKSPTVHHNKYPKESESPMYTTTNYKSKKDLKADVAAGKEVTLFAPGLGSPPTNGTCCVEGPHYPQPHKWYAEVTVKDGKVVKVK